MDVKKRLLQIAGERVLFQEDMRKHTTFQARGSAFAYIEPLSEEEFFEILTVLDGGGIPFYILGKGSNVLVSDEGYEGVILSTLRLDTLEREGEVIIAGAGVELAAVSAFAASESLAGMEFACGIPGTIGGAVYMNAGAYEGSMSDCLESVRIVESDRSVHWIPANQLDLGYRTSNVGGLDRIVLACRLRLAQGRREEILEKMADLTRKREEKQPLELPSAGSTFKRPAGHFAGKLIADAGLRGFTIGGAGVSEKHCGFIINKDHATASEIFDVIQAVKKRVLDLYGVELEREVRLLGDFPPEEEKEKG